MMKQVIFIRHALDRLEERGISKDLVIEIIRDPDDVDLESERRKIAQKLIKGKLLRIVYDDEGELIVVISAYRTSKFRYCINDDGRNQNPKGLNYDQVNRLHLGQSSKGRIQGHGRLPGQ